MASTADTWVPPSRLGEYRIVRPLGRGGMGRVYLAHDEILDRPVAVKLIDAPEPRPDQRERLVVEARAAARLAHPNLLAVYRVGELGGTPYLVTELVRGQSLDQLARPLPWQRVAALGVGLARGLAAAHRGGVLHRDLKPSNAILTDDDTVKIVDFGLAKLLDEGGAPSPVPPVPPAPPAPGLPSHELAHGATITFVPPPEEAPADLAAGLTRRGAVLGTPYYMSPEAWRGDVQTRRSDLYSLGALLYELASGAPPFASFPVAELASIVGVRAVPSLAALCPEAPRAMCELIERCLAADPQARPGSADEVREGFERVLAGGARRRVLVGNPYRGLATYQPEHDGWLFGRDRARDDVLERLRERGLVVIAGDSGVGKSSLGLAAVIPRIGEGALGGGRPWTTASVRPGIAPARAFAEALARALAVPVAEIEADLREPPVAAAHALASRLGNARGVVMFVDPLDDLLRAPADDARAFVALLTELGALAGPLRILATVRTDSLTRLAALDPGGALPRSLVVLPPLDEAGLRAVIAEPARAAEIAFEPPDLVDELVGAAASSAGGLPLLSFALAELWEARDAQRAVIDRAAVARIGGIGGAFDRHADAVIAALPNDQREAARRILVSLVDAADAEVVRGDDALVDSPVARAALEALVRGRLVRAHDGGYGLAHPPLAHSWGTLRAWLDAGVERRARRERIARGAAEWERLGRAASAVWRDRRLLEADVPDDELGPRERAFLRASRAHVRQRRLVRVAAALAVPVAIAGVVIGIRVQAGKQVAHRAATRLAEARAEVAAAQRASADLDVARRAALARFDARDPEAEAAWTAVGEIATAVDTAWAHAAQLAETALLIDARPEARGTLADALLGRALAAEAMLRRTGVSELVERLALYDDGSRRAAWTAGAELALATTPTAGLALEQFVTEGERSRWVPVASPPTTPATLALAPGSYRARVTAPDHAPAYVPFVLARAERYAVSIVLPPAARVPDGWVFVPAGRFLVGSAADDQQRRSYFQAEPLHEATTGAYLIQAREATWGAWIEYLDALAPAERAAALPHAVAGGPLGGVELREVAGTWELRIQPGARALRARLGEPLHYPDRTRNATQDWRKLPVTGISAEQIRAYAAYLARRTGVATRMCREREWERAARGADGRWFPHGQHVAADDVNYEATYGAGPTTIGPDEVGTHPASRSPFGLDDMAGNVFELVAAEGDGGEQWARGGAYAFDILASRTELRDRFDAKLGYVAAGFRLCADLP